MLGHIRNPHGMALRVRIARFHCGNDRRDEVVILHELITFKKRIVIHFHRPLDSAALLLPPSYSSLAAVKNRTRAVSVLPQALQKKAGIFFM
jgi:hypothetical protein